MIKYLSAFGFPELVRFSLRAFTIGMFFWLPRRNWLSPNLLEILALLVFCLYQLTALGGLVCSKRVRPGDSAAS